MRCVDRAFRFRTRDGYLSRTVIAHVYITRNIWAEYFLGGLIISEQACKILGAFSRGAKAAITNFSSRSSRYRCLYHTRLVYNLR